MKRLLSLPLLIALALPVLADADDHDRARSALERGQILPLTDILAIARDRVGDGRLIGVEFEYHEGLYIYELEMITPDGRMIELELDAATGAEIGAHPGRDD
ncbi:PepSY domain-containing protein [Pseudodonghicola sp.]|uniref:PepSY domain-containing protein n=1 Tax=Pseudodonghicola sp. TaxID=1969463 RepID=UPI003A987A71